MPPSAREHILDLLERHQPAGPREEEAIKHVRTFVEAADAPLDRFNEAGHVVASGLVASRTLDRVVLLHHRGLDRWLQCGGHAEPGETRPRKVARRETLEETGFEHVDEHPLWEGLLDVDVHKIPATSRMPAHLHMDLRFLFQGDPEQVPRPPEGEAHEARWFPLDEARRSLALDEGLQRLLWKAHSLRVDAGHEASRIDEA